MNAPLPAPRMFSPGDRFHHYEVRRFLGEGHSGEVYEVANPHLGRAFALKIMRLADREDPKKIARALAEGKGAFAIEHANVVRVFDLGCELDGRVWILMELLEGETLAARLARQTRLSPLFALHVAIDAAWGLDAAHEAQVIHRDVKPANLFLTREGVVKVLDFSVAKVIPEGLQTTLGKVGLGSPAYMAPERFRGARPDGRLDVYALGITLWQMLAGRHPFHEVEKDLQGMIERQLRVMPAPLAGELGLPAYLDEVIARAVAKDPDARPRTMGELAQALSALRDRLLQDARAERVVLPEPPEGEPTLTEPGMVERAYQPPGPAPRAHTQPDRKGERIIVRAPVPPAPPAPSEAPAGLLGPRLLAAPPRAAIADTKPEEAEPEEHGPRGTVLMPHATRAAAAGRETAKSSPPNARETPAVMSRRIPGGPPTERRGRRAAGVPGALAVLVGAAIVMAVIVARLASRPSEPAAAAPPIAVPVPAAMEAASDAGAVDASGEAPAATASARSARPRVGTPVPPQNTTPNTPTKAPTPTSAPTASPKPVIDDIY